MKSKNFVVLAVFLLIGLRSISAQNILPSPSPSPLETSKLSELLAKNLEQFRQNPDISRERREQAYAKLLEAQRYIWNLRKPQRSQAAFIATSNLARQSLQKAVELDPNLAECYTALSEIVWTTPPNNLEEAISLANIAIKIEPDNFGGHQLLARFYTIKSGLNKRDLDAEFAQKAVSEWKEIARLDNRNAESFAFLSAFYGKQNKSDERIESLKKWLAAATPLDARFYRIVMGKQADLSPNYASFELGEALLQAGETGEAVEILSRAVSDNPDNLQAIELLREAIEASDNDSIGTAIPALQQAAFANPENSALTILLAQVQMRIGNNQEALKTIRAIRVRNPDDYGLLRAEASVLADSGKVDEAVALIKGLINKKNAVANLTGNTANKNKEQGIITAEGNTALASPIYDDFTNYLLISNLYSQSKRGKQAVEAANQAIKVAQSDERKRTARIILATAQQTAGEYAGAETTLRELLRESPQNPTALNNLGYFLIERDEKLNEALGLIQQAVKLDSSNPSYLDSLGWAYFKLGKLDEAEKYLKDALGLDSSSTTINEHLGDVHQKQGKTELAKSAWQKALTLTSDGEEINRLKTKINSNVMK